MQRRSNCSRGSWARSPTEGGGPIEGITVTARNYNNEVLYSGVTGVDGGYALDLTNTSPDGDGYSVEFIDPTGTYAADVFDASCTSNPDTTNS